MSLFGTLSSVLVSSSAPPEALKKRKKTRMRRRVNQLLPESDESEGNLKEIKYLLYVSNNFDQGIIFGPTKILVTFNSKFNSYFFFTKD